MVDLKPCPFCGGKAHFDHDDAGWNWIECSQCHASSTAAAHTGEDCQLMLRERWNRRETSAGVLASDEEQPPCPICGGTERSHAGYLLCECPAASLEPADGVALDRHQPISPTDADARPSADPASVSLPREVVQQAVDVLEEAAAYSAVNRLFAAEAKEHSALTALRQHLKENKHG